MKRRVAALLVAVIALTQSTSTFASLTSTGEQWISPKNNDLGYHSLLVEDRTTSFITHSQLQAFDGWNWYLCKSVDDPRCESARSLSFAAILPACLDDYSIDCIRSLEAIHPDGRIDSAKFVKYTQLDHPNTFKGDPTLGVPNPAMPSLWEFSNSSHMKGNQYAIEVGVYGEVLPNAPKAKTGDFAINLHPISVKSSTGASGDSNLFRCYEYVDAEIDRQFIRCDGGNDDFPSDRCAFTLAETRACLLTAPFPEGVKFRVTVDLSTEPSGWFHGRMKDPEISLNPIEGSGVRLTVEALPTHQPIFYWGEQYSEMPSEVQRYWNQCIETRDCYDSSSNPWDRPIEPDGTQRNVRFKPGPNGWFVISFLSRMLSATEDRAVAMSSAWNLNSLDNSEMIGAQSCYTNGNGVRGIITTNASAYSPGPPLFDGSALNYQVVAPHFTPQGEVFRGTYNLVLRSDVVRCIYDFSNAPISASIEVVSENGQPTVATTFAGERDGWLYLSAHNFTFSAPSIRAKFSQVPPKELSTLTTKKSKGSIRCLKGHKTKKVTAVKPKCPKGWKKA